MPQSIDGRGHGRRGLPRRDVSMTMILSGAEGSATDNGGGTNVLA